MAAAALNGEVAVLAWEALALGQLCAPEGEKPSCDNQKGTDGHIWAHNLTKNQNADRGAEHQLQIGERLYRAGLSHLVTADQ